MYDFIMDTTTNFVRHGLNPTAIVLSMIALLRVNSVRRAIYRRLPKRLRLEADNELQEIKEDIRAIKQHLGVVVSENSRSVTVGNGRLNSVQLWIGYLKAIPANQYLSQYKRRVNKLGNINKGILLPLFAAIATFLKQAYGIEIPVEMYDMYANLTLYLLMLLGIFMSPKKKKETPQEVYAITVGKEQKSEKRYADTGAAE